MLWVGYSKLMLIYAPLTPDRVRQCRQACFAYCTHSEELYRTKL
jgi:hypothetical protein